MSELQALLCWCMLRLTGLRSDDACLMSVALDVLMLLWFVFLSPAPVHESHTYTVTTGTKARAWRTAVVVLLLLYWCCSCIHTGFVAARLSGCFFRNKTSLFLALCAHDSTHSTLRSSRTYTHRSTVRGCHEECCCCLADSREYLNSWTDDVQRAGKGKETKHVRGERAISKFQKNVGFSMHLLVFTRRSTTP